MSGAFPEADELLRRVAGEPAGEARRGKEQTERDARRRAKQQSASLSERFHRDDGSESIGSRYVPPLELVPFSEEWLAWYEARRLRSENDFLNHNDARRGIVPPREQRARERKRGGSVG